jgi:hypothetical protein
MSPFTGDSEEILYSSILNDRVQYNSKVDKDSKAFCEKVSKLKNRIFAPLFHTFQNTTKSMKIFMQ